MAGASCIWSNAFQSTCLREARLSRGKGHNPACNFNPRAYVRHDALSRVRLERFGFQSTCLREARLLMPPEPPLLFHFNPRAYVRHDPPYPIIASVLLNFNPRAYVRHDCMRMKSMSYTMISIHVPT